MWRLTRRGDRGQWWFLGAHSNRAYAKCRSRLTACPAACGVRCPLSVVRCPLSVVRCQSGFGVWLSIEGMRRTTFPSTRPGSASRTHRTVHTFFNRSPSPCDALPCLRPAARTRRRTVQSLGLPFVHCDDRRPAGVQRISECHRFGLLPVRNLEHISAA